MQVGHNKVPARTASDNAVQKARRVSRCFVSVATSHVSCTDFTIISTNYVSEIHKEMQPFQLHGASPFGQICLF